MAKKKNSTKSKKESNDVWPLVLGLALLIIVITILVTLLSQQETMPEEATFQEALAAFRAQNVSEIIVQDLARDFANGTNSVEELGRMYPGFEADIRAVNNALKTGKSDVIAMVNGMEITRAELQSQMALLPQELQVSMGEDQVLNQMIDEQLLVQEAARMNITPSLEEIDAAYQNLLLQGDLTEAQLVENIAVYGLDLEDIRELLTRQLTINKLFNETVESQVVVSEEEKREFYDTNIQYFETGEEVTVRHILIATAEQSEEDANTIAEGIVDRLEKGEDFCDLVVEASQDLGSKDTCGEYTFGRNFMVPEFEEASFRLNEGETEIVQTDFGFHIVEKLGSSPATTIPYEEVETEIGEQIASRDRTLAYQDLIERLREEGEIINYLDGNQLTGDVVLEVDDGEVVVDFEDIPAEGDVVIEAEPVSEPEEPVEEATPIETEEPVEAVVEPAEPEPVETTPTEPTTEPETLSTAELAACLGERGTLYTSSWAPSSLQEAEKFGDAASSLIVVDCAEESCPVKAYPAWEINGITHIGSLSFEELDELAEC